MRTHKAAAASPVCPALKDKHVWIIQRDDCVPGRGGADCPGICVDEEPVACCEALTAECLACGAGMTVDDYCRENPETIGCPEEGGRNLSRRWRLSRRVMVPTLRKRGSERLHALPFSRRTLRWICSAWNANSRCAPELRCAPVDPRIPDLPGMCRVSCESNRDCAADAYCAEDGVCREDSSCFQDADCNAEGNDYNHIQCVGSGVCNFDGAAIGGTCGWACDRREIEPPAPPRE